MTEETKTEETTEETEPKNLYDAQVEKFRKAIETLGFEGACERYGFAIFHSLPVDEKMMFQRQFGWVPDEPEDTYNLANVHAMKDELDEAIKLWQKALKAKPDLEEAVFNLAVAYEKQDDSDKALDYYKQFIEMTEDEQEIEKVQQHVAENFAS